MKGKNLIIFLLIFFLSFFNLSSAQKIIDDRYLYFSFKKINDRLIINIEGYLTVEGKKYSTTELNYEWRLNLGENFEKIKTYQPVLAVEDLRGKLSGVVNIFSKDLSFNFEKYFTFSKEPIKKVVIVKYDQNKNLALPFTNQLKTGEVLYPLIYNFYSTNLAYIWTVNDKNYYNSFLLDIKDLIDSLTDEIKVDLRVYNVDNPQESAVDQVIIKK
ncbi:MAG: hypothetical protein NZ866_00765 [Patescibacteria group bacterium]|nr:hypothetical protein [Patescibacteria group bacterium]